MIFRLALDLDLKCQLATSIVCDTDYEHPMRAFFENIPNIPNVLADWAELLKKF